MPACPTISANMTRQPDDDRRAGPRMGRAGHRQHRRRLLRHHARAYRRDRARRSRGYAAARDPARRAPHPARRPRADDPGGLNMASSPCRVEPTPPRGPAAQRLRQYRRAHQRHRLGRVQEADHGGRLCRRGRGRAPAGRERRADHRRQHGRGPARRRGGDDHLPQADRRRARHRARAGHDRQLEMERDRGRAEMRLGQADRQFDQHEGRRGGVPRTMPARCRDYGAAVVVMAFDETGQADTQASARSRSASAPTSCWSATAFRPRTSSSIPTSSRSRPGSTSIAATRSISSRRAARSGRAARTSTSRAASRTSASPSAATSRCAARCTRCSCIHAIPAGLDMAIVNAGQLDVYDTIDPELREACEDVILDRRDGRDRAAGRRSPRSYRGSDPVAREGRPRNGAAGRSRSGSSMRWSRASTPCRRGYRGSAAGASRGRSR